MQNFNGNVEDLLLDKAVDPLSLEEIAALSRIEKLDVKNFTEADVREEVINQILQILGYKKGQDYSVDREKHIRFVGKTHRYIDYNLTLWNKNFWLIEAKKPLLNKASFGYKELSQALEYAAHPDIDVALVVLCDGLKFEVFDRERSVETPILKVKISELTLNFQKIKKILSPVQVWFFYRRRVIRAIDRAFEKECNQNRVDEFKEIIDSNLGRKRAKVLENFQQSKNIDKSSYEENLAKASVNEIVDAHFFYPQSVFSIGVMTRSLIVDCERNSSFSVFYKIFPDSVRDVNDLYYSYALQFLIDAKNKNLSVNWLPGWLGGHSSRELSSAIKILIGYCLTHFGEDPARKTVMLAANVYRRIFKILAVISPYQKKMAESQHLLTRYSRPEFSLEQILSSVEQHSISSWQWLSVNATDNFVRKFQAENGKFNSNLAKQSLQQLWKLELELLIKNPNYKEILQECNFGECFPTEVSGVVYDNFGHHCLCILENYADWKEYSINIHRNDIEKLAELGSWAANNFLGNDDANKAQKTLNFSLIAERFFFGDMTQAVATAEVYGYKK